jgi:hypothetical protein
MKFKVEYANGKTETVEQADCQTVEQFINCKFGRNAKPEAKVTLVEGKAEAVTEETKVTKSTKAKK